MSLLTAWQFMIDLGHDVQNAVQPQRHVPVPLAGKTVLVNGAAGGVGHFAVQIAKWKGARVIAVASGGHEAFLRYLGADTFIDYARTPPEDVARDVGRDSRRMGTPRGIGSMMPRRATAMGKCLFAEEHAMTSPGVFRRPPMPITRKKP